MQLGPGPTLSEAMDEVGRVGKLVGPPWSKIWAAELRELAAKLAEGADRGPHNLPWPREAMRLKLAATVAQVGRGRGKSLDSKSVSGFDSAERRDLARFIRRIGGYVSSGGRASDVLDYDAPHFDRAMALIHGDAEPESDDEARELERWRGKYAAAAP